jgi:GDPmannose 4,6-dehydratase
LLLGDATKAKKVLNWQPKVDMKQLAQMMVDGDMKLAENEKVIQDH